MKKISLMKKTRDILGQPFGPILALIGLMSVATFVLQRDALAQDNPSWTPTGSLNTPRSGHTATLLTNGKVLVVGGYNGNSAELYDPTPETWTITGSLNTSRYVLHTATLLPNGKVLVAGGYAADFNILASAELYDPATGTWSVTGNLNTARSWYTATLLANGKVLVVGGAGGDNTAELYDPATGMWSITGNLLAARYGHTATLLQNGKVLIAGGSNDSDLASTLASAELYDPVTGTWSVTGNLNASRIFHSASLLPEGRVLVVGGYTDNWVPANGGFAASPTSLNSAELYDPATGTWSVTASLNTVRDSHTATLLPNGKVLVAGGEYWTSVGNIPNDGTYPCGVTFTCSPKGLNAAELYDVATGTWSVTANLNTARLRHTATLLANGKVLVAAGCNLVGFTCPGLNSAELYNSHPNIIAAFVRQQYIDFFDREPDAGEVSPWVSALDSGLSKADLIEVFMDSEEFRFEGKFIAQTYLGILTRDADYAGFRGWLGALLVGLSREQIVQVFLDSGEFQSRFGSNLTNGQFVERMYNNILLRSSDPGGFNAWVGALNNGQLTKAQMALSFLDSGEFQGLFLSQNRVDISLLYFDMLQRDPDAGGFSYWVEVLSSGVPLTAVIDGFLNSPEYRAGF